MDALALSQAPVTHDDLLERVGLENSAVAVDNLLAEVRRAFEDNKNLAGVFFPPEATKVVLEEYRRLKGEHALDRNPPRPTLTSHAAGEHFGKFPFDGEVATGAQLRIFHVLKGHELTPVAPALDPSAIHTKPLPFESSPTDVITFAVYDTVAKKWDYQVLPHGALSMYPWKAPLHYGDGWITGMVAYRGNGATYVFRPDLHLKRAARDAKRLGCNGVSKDMLSDMLRDHLDGDLRFIPALGNPAGNRYYIRFAAFPNVTGPKLRGQDRAIMLMGTPIGDYKGAEKLKVHVLGERPVVPGLGATKANTNYAEAVRQAAPYSNRGYHEVLFTRHDALQEGVSANVGVVIYGAGRDNKDLLLTPDPELMNVLPGVTMQSICELAMHYGLDVRPSHVSLKEALAAIREGRGEMFMTGTAMTLCEVGQLDYEPEVLFRQEKPGLSRISQYLRKELDLILKRQHPDPHFNDWMHKI